LALKAIRQTEVDQPRPAAVPDDVLGFEIAVDDPVLVNGGEPPPRPRDRPAGLLRGTPPPDTP
jgi:hypothetical protein